MADAYAEGAIAAGHEVRRIEVAKLEFPLLRTQVRFRDRRVARPLWRNLGEDMRSARALGCFYFRSGTEPCRRCCEGLSSDTFSRPGFAMEYARGSMPERAADQPAASARIVVTMGMPVLLYRSYFGASRTPRSRATAC